MRTARRRIVWLLKGPHGGDMLSVGVRELKTNASDILRRVRDRGEVFEVTLRGRVVARIVPAAARAGPEADAVWSDLDRLASEIGRPWPAGVLASDAVIE